MKNFFRNLFCRQPEQEILAIPKTPPLPPTKSQPAPAKKYRKGDVIGGTYEVRDILGKGGFGIVYLVHHRESQLIYALKTFRDELMADPAARVAFKREAFLWVNLDRHPCILDAKFVEEFDGRLFVLMDYVAPDSQGRVSLSNHLANLSAPLGTDQTLHWAIQFCLGMEHAQAHGIECHRDIKPDNILITQDGMLKISDFGLAKAAEAAWIAVGNKGGSPVWRKNGENIGFSFVESEGKLICGTPGYIPPEVYRGEGAEIRSDIYSFGLVLWQLVAGSPVSPFMVRRPVNSDDLLPRIYEQQIGGRVPRIEGPLLPVIDRCLRPRPAERFESFKELREALQKIIKRRQGRHYEAPQIGDKTAAFWSNKGASLDTLGQHEEAITCFDKALAIDPQSAPALQNKGNALYHLGRSIEAMKCYDDALVVNPRFHEAWWMKGRALNALERHEEAIECFDKGLAINPRDDDALISKIKSLLRLGRNEEVMVFCDKTLAIDPQSAGAWFGKAGMQDFLKHKDALASYRKFLELATSRSAKQIDYVRKRIQELS